MLTNQPHNNPFNSENPKRILPILFCWHFSHHFSLTKAKAICNDMLFGLSSANTKYCKQNSNQLKLCLKGVEQNGWKWAEKNWLDGEKRRENSIYDYEKLQVWLTSSHHVEAHSRHKKRMHHTSNIYFEYMECVCMLTESLPHNTYTCEPKMLLVTEICLSRKMHWRECYHTKRTSERKKRQPTLSHPLFPTTSFR